MNFAYEGIKRLQELEKQGYKLVDLQTKIERFVELDKLSDSEVAELFPEGKQEVSEEEFDYVVVEG